MGRCVCIMDGNCTAARTHPRILNDERWTLPFVEMNLINAIVRFGRNGMGITYEYSLGHKPSSGGLSPIDAQIAYIRKTKSK